MTTAGCKRKDTNAITKLSLVLGGCKGSCPYLSVEIDSSTTYKYFCFINCDSTGHFIGKVSKGFIDTLSSKLTQSKFDYIDTLFERNRNSVYLKLIVHYQTKETLIKGHKDRLPEEVQNFVDLVIDKSRQIKLNRNVDTSTWQTELKIPTDNYFTLP